MQQGVSPQLRLLFRVAITEVQQEERWAPALHPPRRGHHPACLGELPVPALQVPAPRKTPLLPQVLKLTNSCPKRTACFLRLRSQTNPSRLFHLRSHHQRILSHHLLFGALRQPQKPARSRPRPSHLHLQAVGYLQYINPIPNRNLNLNRNWNNRGSGWRPCMTITARTLVT